MTDRDSAYVLVPREPTEAMRRAGGPMFDANVYMGGATQRAKDKAAQCYSAMIADAPSATAPTDEALREILARIYDAGGYVSTAGILRHSKDSNATWIAASIEELRAALRRVGLSAPREDVYRAALEEIASGLSVENPYDIANRALKGAKP